MKSCSKFFIFAGFSFGIITSNLESALPPLYESIAEYKALLVLPELPSHLGTSEIIQDIQRNANGFVITTTNKTLNIDLVYDPVDHPGPAKFHFIIRQAQPLLP